MNEKMKNFLKLLGILAGIFLLVNVFNYFSPGKKTGSFYENEIAEDYSEVAQSPTLNQTRTGIQSETIKNSSDDLGIVDKKIIKNGDLNLKINKVDEAVNQIAEIIENQTGEVFSTNFYERVKGQKSGSMTVKVPVDKFNQTLEKIKLIASQVVSESTTGQDVTERYTDLQARLKNKQAEEESFTKILDRAIKIEDVLAVTRELSRVRGEIESLQGQIKLMDSQTEMSTITINLTEDTEVTNIKDNWRPVEVIKESFNDLIDNSQDFINNLIRFVIVGIPSILSFLVVIGIIYWAGKKIWNKFRK